ncbi:hypothetical protein, partial [Streptomyces roseochromogenus]|uniref:Uncharacterized protein n=1 Tax=Streptomyces roseochromogenus subsp. oscitans DS 12.976 TaxID=1352936 RepID=V6K9E3_STRRC
MLTSLAAVVLGALALPLQSALVEGRGANPARLAMVTGVFNLLWATMSVLMIVRP